MDRMKEKLRRQALDIAALAIRDAKADAGKTDEAITAIEDQLQVLRNLGHRPASGPPFDPTEDAPQP